MKIKILITCLAGAILLAVNIATAQNSIPDVITFDGTTDGGGTDDIHPSTYTGPVAFSHQKHLSDYAAGCGDCHHDSDHEPIVGYSPDKSFTCEDCHDEEGLIRGPIAENAASIDDLITHRANVLHMKCIGCHKKHNAKQHLVSAPEACRFCHTKRPQDWIIE